MYHKIEKHPRHIGGQQTLRETHHMKLNKVDEQVIAALKVKETTLAELAEQTNLPSKKVFRSLRKLFENEMIDSQGRKYRLLTDKPPVKGKAEEETPEEE
jgi:predicted transcriptional regulator